LPIAGLKKAMAQSESLRATLLKFVSAFMIQTAQTAIANGRATVEQRLARWLLMAQDRMEADAFPLTQEFAAMMLGASRPTVTIVASTLQKAGLITYHRGQIKIIDREKLEAASCECYRTATDLLLAVTAGRTS